MSTRQFHNCEVSRMRQSRICIADAPMKRTSTRQECQRRLNVVVKLRWRVGGGGFTYIYNEFNKTSLTAGAESRVLRLCLITHPSPRDGDATLQPTWNNRAGEFPPLLSKAEPSQSVNTRCLKIAPPTTLENRSGEGKAAAAVEVEAGGHVFY